MKNNKTLVNLAVNAIGKGEQPKPESESKIHDRTHVLAGRLSAELFPVLSTYFPDFQAKHGKLNNVQMFALAKEYAQRLIIHRVTPKDLANGIERVKSESVELQWSPNPEEFARLCAPTAQQLGLPTFEEAKAEIVKARGVSRGQRFNFSHDLIAELNNRHGYQMHQLSESQWEKRLIETYRNLFKQVVGGTFIKQAPLPQLPHQPDDIELHDNDFYANHKDPLMRRVAKLRRQAQERKANEAKGE